MPTQTACCSCTKATMLTMTATVKAMDSQRWICRTHLFQFNGTSSEDEPKRDAADFNLSAPKPASSFAKNCCHPALAPPWACF